MTAMRIRSVIGGLEISDSALRFAVREDGGWKLAGVRLAAGIIEGGKIKDYAQFAAALKQLHGQIAGEPKSAKTINVIVSLSSVNIYTQVFTLPFIEGENLEKAVRLNIQMVSPAEASQTYSGWQLVNEDQDKLRLEILSAFASRGVVDEISRTLRENGFLSVAMESRALSLARLIREAAVDFDQKKSYLVLDVDANGIDFLIIRQGQLYFEYPTSFRDVQAEDVELGLEKFETVLVRNLHQVLNFYNSHWTEPLGGILLSTPGLLAEIAAMVKNNFSMEAKDLVLNLSQPAAPSWYVALGGGFRGRMPHHEDREISLLGLGAQEEFHMQQTVNFLDFWRLAAPLALGFLLAAFVAADFSISRLGSSLREKAGGIANSEEVQSAAALNREAEDFNRSVRLIAAARVDKPFLSEILDQVRNLAGGSSIIVNRLTIPSYFAPVTLSGEALAQGSVSGFKEKIAATAAFANVDLPLTDVKITPQKTSFSMSFSIAPQAASKAE